jgi:O-antigen ligase
VAGERSLALRSAELRRAGADGRLLRIRGSWWAPAVRTLQPPVLLVGDRRGRGLARLLPLTGAHEQIVVLAGPEGFHWSATYALPHELGELVDLTFALDAGADEPVRLPALRVPRASGDRPAPRAGAPLNVVVSNGAGALAASPPQPPTASLLLAGLGAGGLALGAALGALRAIAGRPDLLPLAVVGGIAALALIVWPSWIVPVFAGLTWTAIGQSFFGGYSPVEAGAVVLFAVAIWRAPERPQLARDALVVCALLGLPIAAAALLSADGADFPKGELLDIAFIPLVALNLRGRAVGGQLAIALAATGLFLGAGGIYSILVHPTGLFGVEQALGTQAARAAGPFGESNFFALSLAALLPFACWTIGERRGALRVLGLASAVALVGGVLSTGSRGGLIASGFALLAVVLTTPNPRLRVAAIVTIVCGVALMPLFTAQTESSQQRDTAGRLTENTIAVKMFEDHPLAGVGPGGYPVRYRDYTRRYGSDPRVLREPHSLPLQIAAEQGIVGILGWLAAGIWLVRRTWRPLQRSVIGRAVLIALGSYLLGSIFLHGAQLRIPYMLAGAALGLASLAAERAREELPL